MRRTVIVLSVAGAVATTAVAAAALSSDPPSPVPRPAQASTTSSAAPSPSPSTTPATSSAATPTGSPFSAAPRHEWRTDVPDDLSVSAGLPDDGGDVQRVSSSVTWSFCDTEAFPVDAVRDAERAGATGPEYADRRDLRVFADDRAAHAFLRRAGSAASDCPEELHGATRWLHSVTPLDDTGEESLRIVQTYETDGMVNAGAIWWTVTRVGNAVLVAATGGEYLPGETLGQGIREHDRLLAPILEEMCVFSAGGCAPAPEVPGDFPLAAGWPPEDQVEPGGNHGLTGPSRSLEPLAWHLCDQPFTATGSTDRLRADWSNVEDYRARELLTFPDADRAVAFTSSFVDYWRGCDRYASGSGYESVQDVRPTRAGGESYALVSWSEYDGAPAIGLTVVHVTRLGRAVLIDTASDEGTKTSAPDQIDSQVAATAEVVDAMCRFTEAGC